MALTFPTSPTINDTYSDGFTTYIWTGTKWKADGATSVKYETQNNTVVDLGSGSSITIDPSEGDFFKLTNSQTQSVSIASSTPGAKFSLEIQGTANTVETDKNYNLSQLADGVSSVYNIFTLYDYIQIKGDGTKLYLLKGGTIEEYTLSTAWDLTTRTLAETYILPISNIRAFYIKPDGNSIFVYDSEYTLYELQAKSSYNFHNTKLVNSHYFDDLTASTEYPILGMNMSYDGNFVYITAEDGVFYQYPLTTAWDLSTVGTATQILTGTSGGVYVTADGFYGYRSNAVNQTMEKYNLSTPYDWNSAVFDMDTSFGLTTNIVISDDGSVLYGFFKDFTGNSSIFDRPMTTPFLINTFTGSSSVILTNNFFIELTDFGGQNASISYGDNGSKLYIIDYITDVFYQYTLATPYDPASVTSEFSQSIASLDTTITGFYWKPDGSEVFFIGITTDIVKSRSYNTAWDISSGYTDNTAKNFSVANEESIPFSIVFKPDGTRMFMMGAANDKVFQYDLSTQWDPSTATLVPFPNSEFDISAQTTNPYDMKFSDDGLEMIINTYSSSNNIFRYTLTEAWNIATASFTESISLPTFYSAFDFSSNGNQLTVITIYEQIITYRIISPYTINWSNQIQWANSTAPVSAVANRKNIIDFVTYDGVNWIGTLQATNIEES